MSKKKGYPRRVTEDNVDKLIERAEKNITLKNIYKISRALGLSISEITKGL